VLLAVPLASLGIGPHDHIPLARKALHFVEKGIGVLDVGAAVNLEDSGVFLALLEVRWLEDPGLDLDVGRGGDPHLFRLSDPVRIDVLRIVTRDHVGLAALIGIHDRYLARMGVIAHPESNPTNLIVRGQTRELPSGRGELHHLPPLRGHPTQNRASVFGEQEVERLSVRRPDGWLEPIAHLARIRDAVVTHGALAIRGEVPGFTARNRNCPQVVIPPERLPLLAEESGERDGLAVGREGGTEIGTVFRGEPFDLTPLGRNETDVEVVQVLVRILHPVRGEGDGLAVGRENRLHVLGVAVGEPLHFSRFHIHHVDVGMRVEEEPQAVFLVVNARVYLERLSFVRLLVLFRLTAPLLFLAQGAIGENQPLSAGGPLHGRH
jgi:hypothetical protein